MTDIVLALTRGHWPSVIGAWLHLAVSFMVWLLMGALSLTLAQDLHLSPTDTALVVSLPLLSGAFLRVVAGWSSDWYGAKPTGVLILVGELAVVLWGWLGVQSYAELLLVAFLLGIGGASFAVTLPLAGRTYPAAHQGLVLGIVASGNVGTVLILFCAPRIAATGGWHAVFGWMVWPIVITLAVFVCLVRDDRQSRRAERDTHWWHSVAAMIRQPKAYWLCGLYAVTFGGFVGLCSMLPLMFHEQYRLDGIAAGSIAALCGLVGSLIRPLGGYAADRIGGLRTLMLALPLVMGMVAVLGDVTDVLAAVVLTVVAVGAMGVGNGVILQLASEWFPKQIGLASGVVGAAGGIGGFFLPLWLGTLKEVTGSYRAGLWIFALATGLAWGTVLLAERRTRRIINSLDAPGRFPR
ncbi:MAG: Nitrate transporter [Nitrospirota bacterium]|jgi:NNP family nitrate/nitrite transporter-like MFS transporter